MTDNYKILGQTTASSELEYVESFVATADYKNTDFPNAVKTDSENNVYYLGFARFEENITLVKYNSSGELQWARSLLGISNNSTLPGDFAKIAFDSKNNPHIVVNARASGGVLNSGYVVAKWSSDGVLQWQRFLGESSSEEEAAKIAIDSQDNVYFAGQLKKIFGAGINDFVVAKWNSDGVLQWQRFLGGSSGEYVPQIAIDSQDNVYLVGRQFSAGAGSADFVVAKWNSAGVLQWQRFLGGSSSEIFPHIAIDSQDNVYLVGGSFSDNANEFITAKFNSNGELQWQKVLNLDTSMIYGKVVFDSQENAYIVGIGGDQPSSPRNNQIDIVKFNSLGVFQWAKRHKLTGGYENGSTHQPFPSVGPNGELYISKFCTTSGSFANSIILALKISTDGDLEWEKTINAFGQIYVDQSVGTVDSAGFQYVIASYGYFSNADFLLAKLPPNGLTGTYTFPSLTTGPSFEITDPASSEYVSLIGSSPQQAGTLTEQAGTLTEQAGTLTEQAGNLTEDSGVIKEGVKTFLAYENQDTIVYEVPANSSASLSTIAIINTSSDSSPAYTLSVIPAEEVESQTAVSAIGETKLFANDAKAIIPTKTIEPNTTHEILGGITLSAGDQIRVNSDSADLIVQVYGVEIV